jgi:hypothetical protein
MPKITLLMMVPCRIRFFFAFFTKGRHLTLGGFLGKDMILWFSELIQHNLFPSMSLLNGGFSQSIHTDTHTHTYTHTHTELFSVIWVGLCSKVCHTFVILCLLLPEKVVTKYVEKSMGNLLSHGLLLALTQPVHRDLLTFCCSPVY